MQIGEILKEARKERGLTISQVAKELLIQEKYLQALEEGNYEIIPGEAYQRAFFRAYADFLGLGDYIENITHPRAYPKEEEEASMEDIFSGTWDAGRWMRVVGRIALIVVPILLIIFTLRWMSSPKKPVEEPEFTDSTQTLQVGSQPASQTWDWPDRADIANPSAALEDNEHKLLLTATGECWVKVETRDGTLFAGSMYAGDTKTFSDLFGFVVVAGKPEKLDVKFDDERMPWGTGETTMVLPPGAAVLADEEDTPEAAPPEEPVDPEAPPEETAN